MNRLECRVGLGAMAHERVLYVEGLDRTYETWADTRDVRFLKGEHGLDKAEALGEVDVVVVGTEPDRKAVLIELPNEVVLGSRRIWVSTSRVK